MVNISLCRALIAGPVLFLAIGTLPDMATAQQARVEELTSSFNEADLNDDGHLSIDEYVAYLVQVFATVDKDRDGFLNPTDLPTVSEMRFKKADLNNDDILSLGEAMGSKVVDFFDADQNRDGSMDLNELLVVEERLAAQ